jgi:hypothetical protein
VDKHDTVYVTDEWTNTVSVLTTGKWTVRSPRLGADAAWTRIRDWARWGLPITHLAVDLKAVALTVGDDDPISLRIEVHRRRETEAPKSLEIARKVSSLASKFGRPMDQPDPAHLATRRDFLRRGGRLAPLELGVIRHRPPVPIV